MHIVYSSAAGERDLMVTLHNPDATLADLVRAADGDHAAAGSIAVGGRSLPLSCAIAEAGMAGGTTVVVGGAARRGGFGVWTAQLEIVAGPRAGQVIPLPLGRSTIGRHSSSDVRLAHPTVSKLHCAVETAPNRPASLIDLGGANPVLVDGEPLQRYRPVALDPGAVVEVGAFAFVVRPVDDHVPVDIGTDVETELVGRIDRGGSVAFNRPPRARPGPLSGPLAVPDEPREAPRPEFNLTMALGPLVLATVMIIVTGNLLFAMFALLSPVLVIGLYVEQRRRARRTNAAARATYEDELDTLHAQVAAANAHDVARHRERAPDPAEALRRAARPAPQLWERRPHHDDHLSLFAGIADLPWRPQLGNRAVALPGRLAVLPEATHLRSVPIPIELGRGGVVGIVGDRDGALAMARNLVCQAAVHHGPADLTIAVVVEDGREPEWDWAKWLPHVEDGGGVAGARWLGAGRAESDALLTRLEQGAGAATVLVVVDSDTFTEGKDAPARTVLRNDRAATGPSAPPPRVSGIVIASSTDRLPAVCTTVVHLADTVTAHVRVLETRRETPSVLVASLTAADARTCARNLARFSDPELSTPGGELPDVVRLLPLLGLDVVDAASIRRSWQRGGPNPSVPLGVTERGVFTLDLVDDGPHGLVGGMTGSGKSELLRSLVAGLAARSDPRLLTFVLIDYKGGAAFDECARLPHTVGMVTDLDDQLAERALVALNAELHHRERVLRSVGADDIAAYTRLDPAEPLPRLVVVVDEFATLAKELPEFMTALVGIAQRGRSLGVHMILATQRPSGVVNDDIRANTSIKIALRVEDARDSIDVVNVGDAAQIHRARRGRAYARLGPHDLLALQTALVTGSTEAASDVAVTVAPFRFAAVPPAPAGTAAEPQENRPSDLRRLVDAVVAAAEQERIPAPRSPWPAPLADRVELADVLTEHGPAVTFALADDPHRQSQYPAGWDPATGNLVLYGVPGSGTTTTLLTVALSLALRFEPTDLELQVLDAGAGDLTALAPLPHVGTIAQAGDRERQTRLIRHLAAELGRRRHGPADQDRLLVVLIDNFPALRAAHQDTEGLELLDRLTRVAADGQEVGIVLAMTADRLVAVPGSFTVAHRWLFRLADPYDYVSAGIDRRNLPAPIPGRAVVAGGAGGGLHVQVGMPDTAAVVAKLVGAPRVATVIGVLPDTVTCAELPAAAVTDEPWTVPVGIAETDLDIAALQLYEGEHAFVTGPSRSGRSTLLATVATVLHRAGVHVAATGGRRSPLRGCPAVDAWAATPGETATLLARLRSTTEPTVLLVDDAETFDDADAAFAGLLAADLPHLHVVAAAHSEGIRGLYGHWTKTVRRSKAGVLLRPNVDLDGDLLGATLPRRAPVRLGVAGRGYLVGGGEARLLQTATPT